MEDEVVWIYDIRRFAFLLRRDAFRSLVRVQFADGWEEMWIDNEDYEFWEERAIDFESE